MKLCSNCNHITTGNPRVCNRCGRTYDVKLCPRMHVNSRSAEFCSECGSRDLSTPQPRTPVWIDGLVFLAGKLPGILLLVLSVWVAIEFIRGLLTNVALQGQFLVLGLLLGFLWYAYTRLPAFLKRILHNQFKRKRTRKRDEQVHR